MLPNGQCTTRYGVTWIMSITGITSGRTRLKTPFECHARSRRRIDGVLFLDDVDRRRGVQRPLVSRL